MGVFTRPSPLPPPPTPSSKSKPTSSTRTPTTKNTSSPSIPQKLSSASAPQSTSWLSKLRPKNFQYPQSNAQISPAQTAPPALPGWFTRANTATAATSTEEPLVGGQEEEEEEQEEEEEEELTALEEYSMAPKWRRDAAKKRVRDMRAWLCEGVGEVPVFMRGKQGNGS